jgi:hypothetical protein
LNNELQELRSKQNEVENRLEQMADKQALNAELEVKINVKFGELICPLGKLVEKQFFRR